MDYRVRPEPKDIKRAKDMIDKSVAQREAQFRSITDPLKLLRRGIAFAQVFGWPHREVKYRMDVIGVSFELREEYFEAIEEVTTIKQLR